MDFANDIKREIFQINASNFEEYALKVFYYQAYNNSVYSSYLRFLNINPAHISKLEHIPFLPIEFFKTFAITTGKKPSQIVFESSGTTGQLRSKHYVADVAFYNKVSEHIFTSVYGGQLAEYAFIALLPSYAERKGSSLIYMVEHFMSKSAKPELGFYLNDYDQMRVQIAECQAKGLKVVLIGVSFALLDLAENQPIDLHTITIIETGGMKGRRKEMIREELHEVLRKSLNAQNIGSEYGMTELLSQAYAKENGAFETPNWMRILLRNPDDPFDKSNSIKRGGVNVIDLANIDSCCFIETKDLGEKLENGLFKILGRFDNSEIRGCNLLI